MFEMGFVTLFLVGLALELNPAIAMMTAGVLGVFGLERADADRKRKAPRK